MKHFKDLLEKFKLIDLISNKNAIKYVIIFYMAVLLPVIIFIMSYLQTSSRLLREEVAQSMLSAVGQVKINVDDRLKSISDIADMIFGNEILLDALASNPDNQNIYRQTEEMNMLTRELYRYQEDSKVYKIRLYINEDKVYANTKINFMPFRSFQEFNWYKQAREKNGKVLWVPVHNEEYIDQDSVDVVSCVRLLKHKNRIAEVIAGLKIDVKVSDVFNVVDSLNLIGGEHFYLIDHNNNVMYAKGHFEETDLTMLYQEIADNTLSGEGIIRLGKSGKNGFLIHSALEFAGWKIVVYMPMSRIIGNNTIFGIIVALVGLVVFVVLLMALTVVIFAYINKKINQRINNMVLNMEPFESVADIEHSNGLSSLEKSVDNMIITVQNLVEETYEAKLKEREATLKALQAQINPHFLYNTLNLVSLMSIKQGAKDVSHILNAISKYFRLTLNKGRDIVKVADEIELARVYMEIQNQRFEGCILYDANVQSDINDYFMPKLILQPLIENAIIHGILETEDKKGMITLRAFKENGYICFTVTDNGVGIPEDIRKGLLDESGSQTKESYALYNVKERLRMFCGNDYAFTIESTVGKGTTVYLRIKSKDKLN